MPTYPLPHRIHDFLTRQIAWSNEVLAELDAFCTLADGADLDEATRLQARREKETRAMAREYNGLLQEWHQATDIPADLREAVTRHSGEAQELLERVKARYGEAERVARLKKSRNHQALNDLRRGRRSVNIYKPGILVSPGFIDREA
jgi:hypothetical protein